MNDFTALIARSLRTYLRQPAAIIPGFAIAVFFLFVYNAGLSSVASLPGFQGSYLAFILPVAIVSAPSAAPPWPARRSSATSPRATSPSCCSRRRSVWR